MFRRFTAIHSKHHHVPNSECSECLEFTADSQCPFKVPPCSKFRVFRIHSGFTVSKFRVFRVFRIHSGFTVSKFRVFRIHSGFKVSKFIVFRIHSAFTASIQSTTMFQIQSVQSV